MSRYGDNYHPKRISVTGLLFPYTFLTTGVRFANGDTYVNDGQAKQPTNFRPVSVVNVPYCSPFK